MFKELQKVNQLKLYYVLRILLAIGGTFTHTTYYIYLTSTLGFSNTQAMLLDTVLFIGIFFFEVPTGIFGDKYGRKLSFILGRVTLGLSFLIYFVFVDYTALVIGSIFFALGMAFESGAFEAWIIDQVEPENRSKIFTMQNVIGKISMIFIPIISVFIAGRTSFGFPYFISFAFAVITVIVGVIFMKSDYNDEPRTLSEKRGLESLIGIGKSSIKNIFNSEQLRLFFASVLFSAFAFIAINSYGSKLIELTLNSESVGLVISVSSIISIVFAVTINKVKFLKRNYLSISCLGVLALLIVGLTKNPYAIVISFIVQVMIFAVFEIQRQTQINNNIDKNRATVLSIFSFAASISGIVGTVFFGYIADKLGINMSFAIAGLAMIGAIIPLMYKTSFCCKSTKAV